MRRTELLTGVSLSLNAILAPLILFLYLRPARLVHLLYRTDTRGVVCEPAKVFAPRDSLHSLRINWYLGLTERGKDNLAHLAGTEDREPRLKHVVMPFHPRQEAQLRENLLSWIRFAPCQSSLDVEFVFFPAADKDEQLEARLMSMFNELPPSARSCFSKGARVFFSALGPSINNDYLIGSRRMFEQMVQNSVGGMNLERPSYAFYMEPDARPVKSDWLYHLDRLCRFPNEPFWIKGSIFRGDPTVIKSPVAYNLLHINGNALYNLGDPSFRHFYFSLVRPFIERHFYDGAYDTDISKFLLSLSNFDYVRQVAHKFKLTDAIQNRWHSEYQEDQIEGAYIVHGGKNLNAQ